MSDEEQLSDFIAKVKSYNESEENNIISFLSDTVGVKSKIMQDILIHAMKKDIQDNENTEAIMERYQSSFREFKRKALSTKNIPVDLLIGDGIQQDDLEAFFEELIVGGLIKKYVPEFIAAKRQEDPTLHTIKKYKTLEGLWKAARSTPHILSLSEAWKKEEKNYSDIAYFIKKILQTKILSQHPDFEALAYIMFHKLMTEKDLPNTLNFIDEYLYSDGDNVVSRDMLDKAKEKLFNRALKGKKEGKEKQITDFLNTQTRDTYRNGQHPLYHYVLNRGNQGKEVIAAIKKYQDDTAFREEIEQRKSLEMLVYLVTTQEFGLLDEFLTCCSREFASNDGFEDNPVKKIQTFLKEIIKSKNIDYLLSHSSLNDLMQQYKKQQRNNTYLGKKSSLKRAIKKGF